MQPHGRKIHSRKQHRRSGWRGARGVSGLLRNASTSGHNPPVCGPRQAAEGGFSLHRRGTEVEATEGRAPRRVHLARAEPRVHESVSPGHRARQTEASAGFAREGPTAAGLHRPLSREAAASRLRGPAPVSVRAVFPSYDKRHRRHRRREKCLSLGGETR